MCRNPAFFAAPDILSGIFRYFFEVTGIFLKCPIYFCSKVEGCYPAALSLDQEFGAGRV
jgi:hypothetical protein